MSSRVVSNARGLNNSFGRNIAEATNNKGLQNFIYLQENATAVSFLQQKGRVPHFGNLLQCELSGQNLPAKLMKTELN